MHRYPMYAPPGGADVAWDIVGGALFIIAIPLALIAFLLAVHYLFKLIVWVWQAWRRPQRDYQRQKPNPWENEVQWKPEVEEPPVRKPRKESRYTREEQRFEHSRQLGPRSPVRLLYCAAFERISDGELERIRSTAPELIPRLRRAAHLLATRQTQEAEGLLFVVRGMVRRAFGEGKHWLEAIVLADIAALHHHRNQAEDAKYYFEKAGAIALPWMKQYPWLRNMCTARRLIRLK